MSSMDAEEKLVLNHIRDAGNMGASAPSALLPHHSDCSTALSAAAGIWSRTLTTKTGLPRATIAKALKVLEGKKTIKTVKSVKVSYGQTSTFRRCLIFQRRINAATEKLL